MDDEEMIRLLLSRMLTDAGYEAELTTNGAEAIERYVKSKESGQPFDAVILDLTIPGGMGGKETIKKLLEIDPKVLAIVSSGYSTDPIMSKFKEYGFSAVVAKPYSVKELERTLQRLMIRQRRTA
jgi:CheY-like chemotaxis protein